ncbi:MAG: Do family serine endopeptidase [Caulobacteraceae bacterium]|nr:Do family serine endopeptidase [Caulobacteraceae bacterium]
MPSKKTGYILGAVAGAGLTVTAMAAAAWQLPDGRAPGEINPSSVIKASTAPIFAPPPGAPVSFADIFEKVSPAVVSINVTSRANPSVLRIPGLPFNIVPRGAEPDGEGQDGSPGEGGDQGGRTPDGQPRLPEQRSSGSGFFVSADGYIVTNNHVVENAEKITVILKDETELEATVVGRDEGTDIAVLKVQGRNFAYVNFEDAATPRVGDWVITVGNPFGLGGTATAGIVSAYGRDIGETFVDYIQIDAPINRGNSGGPTFDTYVRVIGVNTAIFSPSGGSVGIGFAIPASVADATVKQLIRDGKVERGYIGATIQNYTEEMAEAQGLGDQRGAIVTETVTGGPSAKAGLQPGDVVTSINGRDIKTSTELTRQVARARPGEAIRLEVIRGGKHQQIEIRSGTRPSAEQLAANDNTPGRRSTPATPQTAPAVLGMAVAPIDDAARRRHGLDSSIRGVVIESVDASSDAASKGLRRGDVIQRAGDRAVTSAADISAAVDAAKRAGRPSVLFSFNRGGRTGFLPLNVTG